ncbi:uncharacterized protein LOC122666107 [Telopea speciosissima]|uniref:uncharacterized protein LOC122666107 n=1 Tax=Telopea speciosissima TaxID=54955 RepID=UPI001CC6B45C|nr:uncharacterized protein LOC122666107 [Telopea speciosissima]
MDEKDELSDYDPDESHGYKLQGNDGFDERQRITLEVGLMYDDVNHFKKVLYEYVVHEGFQLLKQKNEKSRVTTRCAGNGCTWRIHASPDGDGKAFMIKTLNPQHTCVRDSNEINVSYKWVAEKLCEELKADPRMSREAMSAIFLKRFGLQVSYMKLWRARKVAHEWNEGNHADSYAMLPSYARLVVQTNPGSMFILQYEDRPMDISTKPVFKRCFVCYKACRDGFVNGCRKFVGLDGCHLKSRFGGVLLSAVAVDGNNSIFSLAFGVVEIENKSNWRFFLDCLHDALGDASDDNTLTFMSDNQKGLTEIIGDLFPYSNIRCCSRHLYQHFKAKFPGSILRRYYWVASEASTLVLFQKAMDTIKSIDNAAYDWVGSLRSKPILSLLDSIRIKVLERLYNRVWECTGVPCKHAAAAISYKRQIVEDYCDGCYNKQRYLVTYANMIHPLPDIQDLSKEGPQGVEQPPKLKRLPGRPHKNRRREPGEGAPADFKRDVGL